MPPSLDAVRVCGSGKGGSVILANFAIRAWTCADTSADGAQLGECVAAVAEMAKHKHKYATASHTAHDDVARAIISAVACDTRLRTQNTVQAVLGNSDVNIVLLRAALTDWAGWAPNPFRSCHVYWDAVCVCAKHTDHDLLKLLVPKMPAVTV
jgi:hypothetical protein